MDEAKYFQLANYLLVANTVPVLWYGVLCFWWTGIARTQTKRLMFAAFGGALMLFVLFRLLVALVVPANLEAVLLIGLLQTVIMYTFGAIFTVATTVVWRRTRELSFAAELRRHAMRTDRVKQLQDIETRLIELGRKHGWC